VFRPQTPQAISRTFFHAGRHFQTDLHVESREVRISELPTRPDDFVKLASLLATGVVSWTGIDWRLNSLNEVADTYAAWTIAYVNDIDQLLFFVDETGEETLSDPRYPVFGLGGCAVMARDYARLVAGPWRTMKLKEFGSFETSMHAAEGNFTATQIAAIAQVFKKGEFYRVVAICAKSSRIGSGFESLYEATALMLLRNLAALLSRMACSGVTTVFEHSHRGDKLAQRLFPLVRASSQDRAIPLRWGSMKKAAGETGLEVADFIMHAAGTQVRNAESGNKQKRMDFKVVFDDVDQKFVEYALIKSGDLVQNPEGTKPGILIDPSSEKIGPESDDT
jgi:hypothetical protein